MKKCCKCGDEVKKAGMCVSCKRAYGQQWYRDNKAKHLSNVKKNNAEYERLARALIIEQKSKPCADCKKPYPYYVMDFDHCRGMKVKEVSKFSKSGRSLETLKKEIAKCDVVCANCHRKRTWQCQRARSSIGRARVS